MSIRNTLLAGPLGFGTAPLGNIYRKISEEEAEATVDAAWAAGIRFFDAAPFYGAGLSEVRLGKALKKYAREEYVLATKVGRLVLPELVDPAKRTFGEKATSSRKAMRTQSLTTTPRRAPESPSRTAWNA